MTEPYTPRSQARPLPARGAPNSAELRAIHDQTSTDLNGIASVANANIASIEEMKQMLFNEMRALKAGINGYYDYVGLRAQGEALAQSGLPFMYINSFSNTNDAYYHPGTPSEHQSTINNDFRVAVPPKNNSLSLFYELPSDRPGEIVTRDPTVTVTATTELDGVVIPGTPLNAFNGNNTSSWVRKVSFPFHHDINEVEMEVIIDVPTQDKDANTIQLLPTPFDSITIKDIQYTTDYGEGWRSLGELTNTYGYDDAQGVRQFTEIKNLQPIQIMIPSTTIRRLKLIVAQDNWVEENGRKVFYYGFQEIGLLFIEWESTLNAQDPFNVTENNNLLFTIEAPTGYKFTTMTFFDSSPYDTAANPALLWQLGKDQYDFSLKNQLWTSLTPTPQSGSAIPVDSRFVYVKCILNMATQDSPYQLGTPAFVQSFMAHFTVQADV